jgi:hypothetical protein
MLAAFHHGLSQTAGTSAQILAALLTTGFGQVFGPPVIADAGADDL